MNINIHVKVLIFIKNTAFVAAKISLKTNYKCNSVNLTNLLIGQLKFSLKFILSSRTYLK